MSEHPFPELLEDYEALVATLKDVARKGKANPYTSVNGHMFSFLSKEGQIAIRLPKDEREAFMKKYKTDLAFTYNTVMKEYVAVPGSMTKITNELAPYMKMSFDYISNLKPKPTKRKKK